jgi:Fe-S cluster assembly ATP-binding protein
MLQISEIHAQVASKPVLKGLSLSIPRGEIHVIMGPNGIGKSTLGHVLMGSRSYTMTSGRVLLDGEDLSGLDTASRARKGLFLGFQYPVSIPGLKISEYLRNLHNLHTGGQVGVSEFRKLLKNKMSLLNIDKSALDRYLNDGFSGGEMKRLEMLQLSLINPKVALLDEIDSGVDIDAQKTIAVAIAEQSKAVGTSFLIVTHYQRLLSFLKPHKIHVMMDGKIVRSGDLSLVESLEREGYDWVRKQTGSENHE